MRIAFVAMVLTAVLSVTHGVASAERRALVIGVGGYSHVKPLDNPVNDARDIADALIRMGFQVTRVFDPGAQELDDAIIDFSVSLRSGDLAVVFFAGHGVETDGVNYLMPADAPKARVGYELKTRAMNMSLVIEELENRKVTLVLFIDACRDSAFYDELRRSRGGGPRGLATVPVGIGTLVAFATESGKTADDGRRGDRNSPYTAALLKHIERKDADLEAILLDVRRAVSTATGGVQNPRMESFLLEPLYLAPPGSSSGRSGGPGGLFAPNYTASAASPTAMPSLPTAPGDLRSYAAEAKREFEFFAQLIEGSWTATLSQAYCNPRFSFQTRNLRMRLEGEAQDGTKMSLDNDFAPPLSSMNSTNTRVQADGSLLLEERSVGVRMLVAKNRFSMAGPQGAIDLFLQDNGTLILGGDQQQSQILVRCNP